MSPAASEEYYQLLMSTENQPCGAGVPSYTVEAIEGVTSEFIVKNAVSVPTSRAFPPQAEPFLQVSRLHRLLQSSGYQEISSRLKGERGRVSDSEAAAVLQTPKAF